MKLRSGKEYSFQQNNKSKKKLNKDVDISKLYTYGFFVYMGLMIFICSYILHQKQFDKFIDSNYEYLSNISIKYFRIFHRFLLNLNQDIIIIKKNLCDFIYYKYLDYKLNNSNFSDYLFEMDDFNDYVLYTNLTN